MSRMSSEAADALIGAWKADGIYGQVMHLFPEDWFPAEIRVRVLMGSGNKLACNALWDKQFVTAKRLLMKYGLEIGSSGSRLGIHHLPSHLKRIDGVGAAKFRAMK